MEILRIENLSFSYPDAENCALSGISLKINAGEFILLCGASGCGKTTLLKMLKRELSPFGKKSGELYYKGVRQSELPDRTSAAEIGFVGQSPDGQIVTDKVWHELAFGLENLGLEKPVIRRRVAEMASYFGINGWYHKPTDSLSGGQKQLLNLASVMVTQPEILILDEPTAQLDPIAASEFIATLKKLCEEFGITVIIVEHRLEELFSLSDRVVVMENGKIISDTPPKEAGENLKNHPSSLGFPSAVRIFQKLGKSGDSPLNVRECRDFLRNKYPEKLGTPCKARTPEKKDKLLEIKDIWFRYEKNSPDILRGVSADIYKGEIYSLVGGNGSGKSTLLSVLSGLYKPYKGKAMLGGKPCKSAGQAGLALLPQDPLTLFVKDTMQECFDELAELTNADKAGVLIIAEALGITELLKRHPFDLSGGEAQKCALGLLLLKDPNILLLDEPTKGLDAYYKSELSQILTGLKEKGKTLVMVTHDLEFAAEVSDKCGLLFDGEILSEGEARQFFAYNSFYTTAAGKIARGLFPGAVLCENIIALCAEPPEQEIMTERSGKVAADKQSAKLFSEAGE